MSQYTPTIGIETHVQLKTKTKLFSAVDNNAAKAAPNTLISHIDVGMPGALPVLNEAALELACRAALALNTKPQEFSKFDRKHYFYPDLPKGYQITQYDQPIVLGGHVSVSVDGVVKKIGVTRVHLEEDAGKNTHPTGADYSLIDLNRAGTPLLEIVSEADIHSAEEAKAYARELYLTMRYADVSDCDLYLGHMRFDVNVSISSDPSKPGTRAEIKNLNSFRSVENAVAYEIERQTKLLERGETVIQETRGWDEAKQITLSLRGKEEAHDYRYMPEPDIPPVVLDEDKIEQIAAGLPMLPPAYRERFGTMGVEPQVIEDLLDHPHLSAVVLQILETVGPNDARRIAFWLLAQNGDDKGKHTRGRAFGMSIDHLISLSQMVDSGELNSSAAKTVFGRLQGSSKSPRQIAEDLKLLQVSSEDEVEKIVDEVMTRHARVVEDIKAGNDKAIGFLVGQVMAKTGGRANPQVAQKIIKNRLT